LQTRDRDGCEPAGLDLRGQQGWHGGDHVGLATDGGQHRRRPAIEGNVHGKSTAQGLDVLHAQMGRAAIANRCEVVFAGVSQQQGQQFLQVVGWQAGVDGDQIGL
jgi:hypothetical protein